MVGRYYYVVIKGREDYERKRKGRKGSVRALPGSCFMVVWLRLEKRRSSCCDESGSGCGGGGGGGGCRSPAYWEQRHRCSCPLALVRLSAGVVAETREGVKRADGPGRG